MSKAILVIDMPDSCDVCKFCYYTTGETPVCSLENMIIHNPKYKLGCPLKKPPEKDEYYLGMSETSAAYVDGWNDCLEEVLEE